MRTLRYVLVTAAILGAIGLQQASAFTEIDPGPAVTGAPGPNIFNGTTTNQTSTSALLTLGFGGKNAADHDQLWLNGTLIFDNNVDPQGALATAVVTPGDPLLFTLMDVTGGNSFDSGTAYTNDPPGSFSPVYHFAFLKFTDAADFNSVFSPLVTIIPGGPIDTYINTHGGYSAWVFGGGEDKKLAALDDWNDLIFAYTSTTVPEASTWAMMALGFAGLGFVAFRRPRRNSAAIA